MVLGYEEMQCTNTLFVKRPPHLQIISTYVEVPCGKCMSCRINRSTGWMIRIMAELQEYKYSGFLTLTYADEYLPGDGSLVKSDLQKFWKRLRKQLDHKIKYYAVGEYGDMFGRPHYHAILFGLGPESLDIIQDAWSMGFVTCSFAEQESIRYVTHYITKKLFGDMAEEYYGDKLPPFATMSKGIGERYLLKNAEQIIKNNCINIQGVKYALPTYFRDKLEISFYERKKRAEEAEQARLNYWKERGLSVEASYDKIKNERIQQDRNVKKSAILRQEKKSK